LKERLALLLEKLCNLCESIIRISPEKSKEQGLQESINICHLNITPQGAASFALLIPIAMIILGLLLGLLVFKSSLFVFIVILGALGLSTIFGKIPSFMANNWRIQASNQMVLSVFYVVTYMRHTSNIENAIDFASEHLSGTLALDFKKVLWDAETGKFPSVKESLDNYLETWRKWNNEFIESFHLIESSLYEGSEDRRLSLLDKSLEVMLEETYEKMLHYAQNLKSPITMIHMLGIILPILGLVILPLVVSFIEGVRWYHLSIIYNVFLPVIVYYLGKTILSRRPTGYGDTDISEENPEFRKYRDFIINLGFTEIRIHAFWIAIVLGGLLLVLGISPLILHASGAGDMSLMNGQFRLLDYKESSTGELIGPYGLGASILSLFIPLSVGLGIGMYYSMRSRNVISIRNKTRALEKEFASALFQLGNRLGDGVPAELAFGRVAESMRSSLAGDFFNIVSNNVRRLGTSVQEAIFNVKIGAIVQFPSKIINSSMKVLTEALKKGPKIAAKAIINVSQYIKEMHRVDERLKDLLADVISSMKSQINFLTPVIAGIVIGITSMVTTILVRLGEQMSQISAEGGTQSIQSFTSLFGSGVPTYYFQIIVGIYVVQVIYILTILVNGIENGADKLNERFLIGRNLIRATVFYVVVSLVVMVVFNVIAAQIMEVSVAIA